jgi:hypothetical protein
MLPHLFPRPAPPVGPFTRASVYLSTDGGKFRFRLARTCCGFTFDMRITKNYVCFFRHRDRTSSPLDGIPRSGKRLQTHFHILCTSDHRPPQSVYSFSSWRKYIHSLQNYCLSSSHSKRRFAPGIPILEDTRRYPQRTDPVASRNRGGSHKIP